MRHATAEHRDEGHDGAEEGVRTCALTRVRRPKDELIRFVLAPDGTVVPDRRRLFVGREIVLQNGVDRVRAEEGDRVLEVWEAAVRATHHFLSESDIQFFKPLVLESLLGKSAEQIASLRRGGVI